MFRVPVTVLIPEPPQRRDAEVRGFESLFVHRVGTFLVGGLAFLVEVHVATRSAGALVMTRMFGPCLPGQDKSAGGAAATTSLAPGVEYRFPALAYAPGRVLRKYITVPPEATW